MKTRNSHATSRAHDTKIKTMLFYHVSRALCNTILFTIPQQSSRAVAPSNALQLPNTSPSQPPQSTARVPPLVDASECIHTSRARRGFCSRAHVRTRAPRVDE